MPVAPIPGLSFASLMASNAMPFCRALVAYLADQLRVPVTLLEDVPWQLAEQRLYRGEAQLGVVCGLQYVRAPLGSISLVGAAVMTGRRYGGQPVYFSDVIVLDGAPVTSLDDLRGARWAYNEPTSHSGHGVVRHALAARGERGAFFGEVIESGAHDRSLQLLLDGRVDGTAIDSTVLEQELRTRPWLARRIRVVDTLGPSPIWPVVASTALAPSVVAQVQRALLQMHQTLSGRAVLAQAAMRQFVAVTDADYAAIRQMAALAAPPQFGEIPRRISACINAMGEIVSPFMINRRIRRDAGAGLTDTS